MANPKDSKNIVIKESTKERLNEERLNGKESYDDIILRLMEQRTQVIVNERTWLERANDPDKTGVEMVVRIFGIYKSIINKIKKNVRGIENEDKYTDYKWMLWDVSSIRADHILRCNNKYRQECISVIETMMEHLRKTLLTLKTIPPAEVDIIPQSRSDIEMKEILRELEKSGFLESSH